MLDTGSIEKIERDIEKRGRSSDGLLPWLFFWAAPELPSANTLDEEGITMARKPNYKFERMERDRAKAEKKAARAKAKTDRVDPDAPPEDASPAPDDSPPED